MENRKVIEEIIISPSDDLYLPDSDYRGTLSRTIINDSTEMRIMILPPGYQGDCTCYNSHSIYVISGMVNIKIGTEDNDFLKESAFIIPKNVSHQLSNNQKDYTQIVIVENKE